MESLLAVLGLVVTAVIGIPGLLYAKSAAKHAKRSVRLQEDALALQAEDLHRQTEAQRPGLAIEELSSSFGGRLISITHLSCAPLPLWSVLSASSLNPDRVRLVHSDGLQRPVSPPPPLPRLALQIVLPAHQLRGEPILFFAMFTPGWVEPVDVEIEMGRANGETFTRTVRVNPLARGG